MAPYSESSGKPKRDGTDELGPEAGGTDELGPEAG